MVITTSAVHTPRTVEKGVYHPLGKSGKDMQIPQSTHHCQHTKQASKRLEVIIIFHAKGLFMSKVKSWCRANAMLVISLLAAVVTPAHKTGKQAS